jgi:hypothetical protein
MGKSTISMAIGGDSMGMIFCEFVVFFELWGSEVWFEIPWLAKIGSYILANLVYLLGNSSQTSEFKKSNKKELWFKHQSWEQTKDSSTI